MKKLLLILFAVAVCIGTSVAAPAPKFKKVKLNKYARYEGMALKKTPQGQGTLYPCSHCTVKGTFNNNKITDGEITFTNHNVVIKGSFTLVVFADKQIEIVINKGKLISNGKGGHPMRKNTQIKFTDDNFIFEDYLKIYPKMPKWYYPSIKQFAGESKYWRKTDGLVKYIYTNEKRTREIVTKSSYLVVTFKNGTTARYEVADKSGKWTRPNGDYIDFTIASGEINISNYKITAGQTTITKTSLIYSFKNGNKYTGTVKGVAAACVGTNNLNKLVSFTGLAWEWADFEKVALEGTVIYADGKSEKVVDGLTESEIARREAERLEAERKAKEEAERLAREEAERKAKEEAERLEAERKAKEEAERLAREEEERKAKEEAERLEAERKAKEEAELLAKERVYSCAYDGFVNIRQQPSNKSAKLGQFRNGPEGAALLENLGAWMKICTADGITGYVMSQYVQKTPTVAYTGKVSANWVEGLWGSYVIYNNGYWEAGNDWCNTKGYWIMQNNEVKLVTVLQLDGSFRWAKVDPDDSDNVEILEIDESAKTLGGYKKPYLPATYSGYKEHGYPDIFSLADLRARGKTIGAEVRKALGK